jgi:hypothetical protein
LSSAASSDRPLTHRSDIIVIPLKPRKKMISLRLNADDLLVIEKFVSKNGFYSRTLILTKLIEAFAEGIRRANFHVDSLKLVFLSGEGSEKKEISIVLDLNSNEKTPT